MALIPTPDIYGHTIFCDDIRHEVGEKHSFVGCYIGLMIVHVPFPVTLQSFALAVTVMQRKKVFDPNFSLLVFLPGDPDDKASIQGRFQETVAGKVAEMTAAETSALHSDANAENEDEYVALNAQMKLSQLVLKQPGMIKVRAIIKDDMFRLGTLRVSPPKASQPVKSELS